MTLHGDPGNRPNPNNGICASVPAAMVRVRFSTPTIGREWMVGEVGTAVGPVAPDGVITVRDAPWRARTSRVTPIDAGQEVRVVSIAGLVLEVEPVDDVENLSTGRRGSH